MRAPQLVPDLASALHPYHPGTSASDSVEFQLPSIPHCAVRGALVASALLFGAARSIAAPRCDAAVAHVVSVQGAIEVRAAGASAWQAVQREQAFCAGDTVRAGEHSRADLTLLDQSVLRLRSGTELTLEGVRDDESYWVALARGAAHFLSRQGERKLEVNTPYTVAGVRGTEFYVGVEEGRTELTVFEGRVLAANADGSLMLADGDSAVAEAGRAPSLWVVASPRDAVRWTLYYPPVVTPRAASAAEPEDARSFTARASERLAVGSIDEAAADLARALELAPDDAEALALEAVVAVAQNRKDDAQTSAERAVAADPSSATARIALSYAQQARFDLAGARASLDQAVELEPDNALAWARLAELRASAGDLNGTLDAAERASALAPDLSRTQTVLGFAHLMRVDTAAARRSFARAIALDQADPTPRLGLGLAKIREGDLDGGARELEVAVSLDPGDAVVRSYLGKAYYEEKRSGLDAREFEAAKQLDPNDPTPWFYDAISKQTTNRPVQALQSLEAAIDRNDNRAVYRSTLLLDSDDAARSASLGRIYSDLGFESLALVEGWKSVNTDVSNHSAHRLLADSYGSQPRHEIARVSELFQAQMLQSNNLVPIQPRQGEGNLFLLSSQGPSNLSFTEFNPLFDRNRVAVQGNGLFGEDETYAGEGIVSGVYDRLSLSAGYSGYWTDGFRPNNEQDDDIVNAFTQFQLTPQTSVQSEFRYRELTNGDLELRFLRDDFSRFSEEETDTGSIRGGLRHAFTPNTILLLSYSYQERDTDFQDFIPDPAPDPIFGGIDFSIDLDRDEVGHNGEGQLIHRQPLAAHTGGWLETIQLVAGGGDVSVDVDEESTTQVNFFGVPDPPVVAPRAPDVEHANVYLYTYTALPENVDVTLGASGDFFHEDDGIGHRDQANPKGGITWNPSFLPGTTLRAAGFRVLTRTLVNAQTLEPTQVAGFNQFFDDPPGTEAWRYGAAIDQKFGSRVFGGVEVSARDLKAPTLQTSTVDGTVAVKRLPWREKLGRGYLLVTPLDWLALRAEYQYELIRRDPELRFAFTKVVTHRVPLGVEVFHPWGWSVSFGATYLDQHGVFLRNSTATFEDGRRDIWVLDTGLRYRLPQRYGFIAFGVNNFLDEDSPYQATDVRNPSLRPGRFIYGSLTLAFP